MTRTKRSTIAKKRRKKILNLAKSFQGSKSKLFRTANQQIMKSLKYSYISRKKKKTYFRKIWIERINITSKLHFKKYNEIINTLRKNVILLNRKIISKIFLNDKLTSELITKIKYKNPTP